MSPGQTGHITGQMGRVPGTDGTHTRGCPAKILYVYWFFSFPIFQDLKAFRSLQNPASTKTRLLKHDFQVHGFRTDLHVSRGQFIVHADMHPP